MNADDIGPTELAILADMTLVMVVFTMAKVFSDQGVDTCFDAIKMRLEEQGFDPENPVVSATREAINVICGMFGNHED